MALLEIDAWEETMQSAATVYLVGDDAAFLDAQARMLRVYGIFVYGFPAAAGLVASLTPASRGCVLTNLSMPDMGGLDLRAALLRKGVSLPFVILTVHGDLPPSDRAMYGSAVEFLEKRVPPETLLAAIRRALDRDAAEHQIRVRNTELRRRFSRLTPREREVLQHVVDGSANKQIAVRLGIHEGTVKVHRAAISSKVGARSAAQLATLARDARVFETDASAR